MIILFGLLTTAASNVFSNIYHVYQAEIVPSDVRATAVGWTYSVSRLSSAALPFVLIPVLNHYGAAAMFTVVLVALAAAVAVLVPFGPRTNGKEPGRNQPDMTKHICERLRAGLPRETGTFAIALAATRSR